jgi:hypothetical protein
MSIADHFEHAPDAGFVRTYDIDSARRQFKLSLTLVVAVLLAVSALAVLIRFDTPARFAADRGTASSVPAYAGRL